MRILFCKRGIIVDEKPRIYTGGRYVFSSLSSDAILTYMDEDVVFTNVKIKKGIGDKRYIKVDYNQRIIIDDVLHFAIENVDNRLIIYFEDKLWNLCQEDTEVVSIIANNQYSCLTIYCDKNNYTLMLKDKKMYIDKGSAHFYSGGRISWNSVLRKALML